MQGKLSEVGKLKRFYDKCQDSLCDSDPPQYCKICGVIKKEFTHPRENRISLIDCQCERDYNHYKEVYDNFRKCEADRNIQYFQLIDAHIQPKSHQEKSIAETGRQLRETVGWYEKKIKRGER